MRKRFVVGWTIIHADAAGNELVTSYSVTPLRADPAVARFAWRFTKLDEDGKLSAESYDIRVDDSGFWHCECKGFLGFNYCKHVRTLRVFLGLPADPPAGQTRGELAAGLPDPAPESPAPAATARKPRARKKRAEVTSEAAA